MSNYESYERKLLRLCAEELIRRLEDPETAAMMTASELAVARQMGTDAGISLSDIRAGDFGEVARDALSKVEQENEGLPFDPDLMPENPYH